MSKKNNATCAICGKGYVMCRSCDRNKPGMVWKLHCDCPEHYKIFQVIHGYTSGKYTDEEAAKKLERIDLSDFDELRDSIKETLNKIRAAAKQKVKVVEPAKHESIDAKPSHAVDKQTAKVSRRLRSAEQDVHI